MPDISENAIKIRVRDPGLFVDGSNRTIAFADHVQAAIGHLRTDPDGPAVIQAYVFDRSEWTMEDAQKWVREQRPSGTIERRCFEHEARLDFNGKTPKITGYAAVFNEITELFPGYKEKVAPGAFAETIKKDDIRALWNHNPDYLLGRTKSKTLRLWEDERGLGYEIIPPNTTWAADLMTLMKRGDLSQSSFGFNIIKQSNEVVEKNREVIRTIEKAKLFDVSPVTFPAYSSTDVHVRMTQHDHGRIYVIEDEVIEVPLTSEPAQAPVTDEELFRRFAEARERFNKA